MASRRLPNLILFPDNKGDIGSIDLQLAAAFLGGLAPVRKQLRVPRGACFSLLSADLAPEHPAADPDRDGKHQPDRELSQEIHDVALHSGLH